MATSIDDLKSRLRRFLADPRADDGFRQWFAFLLADIQQEKNEELESLVYAIHEAFSDAAEGVYSPQELKNLLADIASPESVDAGVSTKVETSIEPDSHGFWVMNVGLLPQCADRDELSASQVLYPSPSGALIPPFFSCPEPVSTRDEQANFWGTAAAAQRQSAA
jgi:hypothetical protein